MPKPWTAKPSVANGDLPLGCKEEGPSKWGQCCWTVGTCVSTQKTPVLEDPERNCYNTPPLLIFFPIKFLVSVQVFGFIVRFSHAHIIVPLKLFAREGLWFLQLVMFFWLVVLYIICSFLSFLFSVCWLTVWNNEQDGLFSICFYESYCFLNAFLTDTVFFLLFI